MSKKAILWAKLSVFLCVGALCLQAAPASAQLSDGDCVKCHAKPPADIKEAGLAHKTDIGCQDCHEGHRPASKNNIPQCSNCHEGEKHFELKGCLNCHTNPHRPKDITLGKNVTDACLTCHTDQMDQLKSFKSKHSLKACSSCHDKHGKIPACVSCHQPHSKDMGDDQCGVCHQAHQPLNVTYADGTDSKLCASCHASPYQLLQSNGTKHTSKVCASCHQSKHKAMPTCQQCHKVPHPAGIMSKFPSCNQCHKIAHDLNNWTRGAEPAKKPAAKKKGR
ncbi:MAG: cytochrome C [Deltaproteobacteria bacterium]|nr:cytochrome C [Deltaproteobacteria bacterium]